MSAEFVRERQRKSVCVERERVCVCVWCKREREGGREGE